MSASALTLPVQVLAHGEGLPLPRYASDGAAGADLYAAVDDPVKLLPGRRAAIPTGLAFAVPEGYEAQIRPRSGLALRNGVTLLNTPGTIDADYRGEVKIILINLGGEPFTIARGDRIAQVVIAPVTRAAFQIAQDLGDTARGAGGFGSTGVSD